MTKIRLIALIPLLAAAVAGCGGSSADSDVERRLDMRILEAKDALREPLHRAGWGFVNVNRISCRHAGDLKADCRLIVESPIEGEFEVEAVVGCRGVTTGCDWRFP